MAKELAAVRAAPAFVRGREVATDVAERECAEDGVAQRVDHHVAIAVCLDPARVRDPHAAEHHVVAVAEGVDVEALADAQVHVAAPLPRRATSR